MVKTRKKKKNNTQTLFPKFQSEKKEIWITKQVFLEFFSLICVLLYYCTFKIAKLCKVLKTYQRLEWAQFMHTLSYCCNYCLGGMWTFLDSIRRTRLFFSFFLLQQFYFSHPNLKGFGSKPALDHQLSVEHSQFTEKLWRTRPHCCVWKHTERSHASCNPSQEISVANQISCHKVKLQWVKETSNRKEKLWNCRR